MRTPFTCALVFLCGAEIASAQQWPAYAYPGYAPSAAAHGYGVYPQGWGQPGYNPYYRGYNGTYRNYYPHHQASPAAPGFATVTTGGAPAPVLPAPAAAPSHAVVEPSVPAETVMESAAPAPADGEVVNTEAPTVAGFSGHGRHDRLWITADYLLAWFKNEQLPAPLVTIAQPADPTNPNASPGALGNPSTAIAFGDRVDFGALSGCRLNVGVFLDDECRLSLDCVGLGMFPKHVRFGLTSDAAGNPFIAVPVYFVETVNTSTGDVTSAAEGAFFDSQSPSLLAGSVAIDARTELYGCEVNGRYHLFPWKKLHLDALSGFRFMYLADSLTMQNRVRDASSTFPLLTFLGTEIGTNASLGIDDSFQSRNLFYGLQLGGRIRWETEHFVVGAFTKLAVGAADQIVNINGSTTLFSPSGNQVASGGYLALPSNIGRYERTVVGFIPEVGITGGVALTKHLSLMAGYSLLVWNSVVRAGSQIDHSVNSGQPPSSTDFGSVTGVASPVFAFNDEVFWIHSINLGLGFNY